MKRKRSEPVDVLSVAFFFPQDAAEARADRRGAAKIEVKVQFCQNHPSSIIISPDIISIISTRRRGGADLER